MVTERAPSPHDRVFWEMARQTAVRQGDWKLVLNGQLAEGVPPEDAVFLANLADDPGERTNLARERPDLVAALREASRRWRDGIEARWANEWQPEVPAEERVAVVEEAAEWGIA
jgi:arylsulfatase A-like enzyme